MSQVTVEFLTAYAGKKKGDKMQIDRMIARSMADRKKVKIIKSPPKEEEK